MSLSLDYVGYRAGLRQPALQLTLHLVCPNDVDYASVDGWLESSFGIKCEPEPTHFDLKNYANAQLVSFAWRVLSIARSLQQSAQVPVFETGLILDVKPTSGVTSAWQVNVVIARPDLTPETFTLFTYEAAYKLATWIITHYRNPPDLENTYKNLEETVIKRLCAMAQLGTSFLPILNEAYLQDIPFRLLGAGVYQLGWGCRARLMDRSALDRDSAIGARLVHYKHWTAQVIRSAGLPSPEHCLVSNEDEARDAADKLGWPLVVKPTNRDRGEGVTVGIKDTDGLVEGFGKASALSKDVLVEREVPGICYRLLIANGEYLYALRRGPRSVVGDGQLSIAELIQQGQKNAMKKPTWTRGRMVHLDSLALDALSLQGLTAETIPESGQLVAIRRFESTEWGGNIEDATDLVHPDNIDIALRAARLFGLSTAGIDIITTDISIPWHESRAIINEVNFCPYFGGNTIAKAKLPMFIRRFMEGDGRIPVEVYLGGYPAMEEARSRQQQLVESGVGCYLSSHEITLTKQLALLNSQQKGLFDRVFALLMNRDVEFLIMVVQTDELLHSGLPVDRVHQIHVCPGRLASWGTPAQPVNAESQRELVDMLRAHEMQHTDAPLPD